jgi:outer membrane lipoprotein carrier protein
MRFFAIIVVLVMAVASLSGSALAMDAAGVVAEVQKRYKGVETLTADFVQVTFLKSLNASEEASGKVSFKKPGRMRWTYSTPAGNEMVSDGETIWIYDAELSQVIETQAGRAAAEVALEFLAGTGDIEKGFFSELSGEADGVYILDLVPREATDGVVSVRLEVDKKSFHVVKTIIDDGFGGETTLVLKGVKFNTPLEDEFFKYTVPKGVSVVRP